MEIEHRAKSTACACRISDLTDPSTNRARFADEYERRKEIALHRRLTEVVSDPGASPERDHIIFIEHYLRGGFYQRLDDTLADVLNVDDSDDCTCDCDADSDGSAMEKRRFDEAFRRLVEDAPRSPSLLRSLKVLAAHKREMGHGS